VEAFKSLNPPSPRRILWELQIQLFGILHLQLHPAAARLPQLCHFQDHFALDNSATEDAQNPMI
jgi:hypothetical protein